MNLTITNATCEDIIFNGNYLEKLYYGNDLVWEKTSYKTQYLTAEALEPGTIGMRIPSGANYNGNNTVVIYTSTDNGSTWTSHTTDFHISVNTGDKVLFKQNGNLRTCCKSDWSGSSSNYWFRNCIRFWCTCKYKVYGNIQSLWYGDNFANQTTIRGYRPVENSVRQDMKYTFGGLFSERYAYSISIIVGKNNQVDPPVAPPATDAAITDVSSIATDSLDGHYLVDASNLILPLSSKTTINSNASSTWLNWTYYCMFENAQCLQYAPRFENIDCIGKHDFDYMFHDCFSLISAPISFDCYFIERAQEPHSFECTFENCFRLVNGPTIFRPWYGMNTMYGGNDNGIAGQKDFFSETKTFCNCQSLRTTPTIYVNWPNSNSNTTRAISMYNSSTQEYTGFFGNCRSLEKLEFYKKASPIGTNQLTLTWSDDGTYTITPTVISNITVNVPNGWSFEKVSTPS